MRTKLIGIGGKYGSGKDFFATMIASIRPGIKIVHFADDLKEMAVSIFGLTMHQVYDPIGKATPFVKPAPMDDFMPGMGSVQSATAPIVMDDFVTQMSAATGLDILPRGIVAETPRHILQYFGTEYVRSIKNSYWIDRTMRKVSGSGTLVPDMRFPDEVNAIRDAGGLVVRLIRDGDVATTDAHVSERLDYVPDETLHFRTGDLELIRLTAERFVKLLDGAA